MKWRVCDISPSSTGLESRTRWNLYHGPTTSSMHAAKEARAPRSCCAEQYIGHLGPTRVEVCDGPTSFEERPLPLLRFLRPRSAPSRLGPDRMDSVGTTK